MAADFPTVAVLGTGTMGAGMAGNIAAADLPVRVWNRSRDKAEPLAAAGATVAASPAEAVECADLVLTMLFDEGAVRDVMADAGPSLRPGTVWVQASTVGVDGAQRLAELAAGLRLVYVDAPVLGTKQPAQVGQLIVLASGPDESRDVCAPVFEAVGSRTLWVGPAGNGSRLKLAVNSWVLLVNEGVAESLALTEALGLDPELFLQTLEGGPLDSPYLQLKGKAMLAGAWDPAFALAGAAKDAGLIVAAADRVGTDAGLVEVVRDHLERAVSEGHGDLDMAATYLSHLRR